MGLKLRGLSCATNVALWRKPSGNESIRSIWFGQMETKSLSRRSPSKVWLPSAKIFQGLFYIDQIGMWDTDRGAMTGQRQAELLKYTSLPLKFTSQLHWAPINAMWFTWTIISDNHSGSFHTSWPCESENMPNKAHTLRRCCWNSRDGFPFPFRNGCKPAETACGFASERVI